MQSKTPTYMCKKLRRPSPCTPHTLYHSHLNPYHRRVAEELLEAIQQRLIRHLLCTGLWTEHWGKSIKRPSMQHPFHVAVYVNSVPWSCSVQVLRGCVQWLRECGLCPCGVFSLVGKTNIKQWFELKLILFHSSIIVVFVGRGQDEGGRGLDSLTHYL